MFTKLAEILDGARAAVWSPVRKRGAFGEALERRRARSAPRGGPGPVGDGGRTPREVQHASDAAGIRLGVLEQALGRIIRSLKRQTRHDTKADLLMPPAAVAGGRADTGADAERAVRERLLENAPETLGYRSPWTARFIGVLLCLGGCILNASTYDDFEPSSADGVTQMLDDLGLSISWVLGGFQMIGMTLLGYAVAYCASFALAPRRGMYGARDDDGDRRVVYGAYSPRVYGVFGVVFFAFALVVAYAIARLRVYGSLLDSAVTAGAPGSGAAGSLGGGASGASAAPPADALFTFMVLALLELTATLAVFTCLDPAVSRVLRALRRNAEREIKHTLRRGRRANRARVAGVRAALDGLAAGLGASVRTGRANIDAIKLDAIHREANPDRFPATYDPDLPEDPDLIEDAGPLGPGRVSLKPYAGDAPAPMAGPAVRRQGASGLNGAEADPFRRN